MQGALSSGIAPRVADNWHFRSASLAQKSLSFFFIGLSVSRRACLTATDRLLLGQFGQCAGPIINLSIQVADTRISPVYSAHSAPSVLPGTLPPR